MSVRQSHVVNLTTPDASAVDVTQSASSAFTKTTTKKRCGGKCGQFIPPEESYPQSIDWLHNNSATPYCLKCFANLGATCDALADTKGASKKGKGSQQSRKRKSPVSRTPETVSVTTTTTPPAPKRGKKVKKSLVLEVLFAVGTKVKSTGTRWKLPSTQIFFGEIVEGKKYYKTFRYKVKWGDGVVESLKHKDIVSMIVKN